MFNRIMDDENIKTDLFDVAFGSKSHLIQWVGLFYGKGEDTVGRDGNKYSLMIRAILLNDYHGVRALLLSGYPINHIDDTGRTALHIAARHGSDKVIEALIERGADLSLKDGDGFKAIEIALQYGHIRVWRSINLYHSMMVRDQSLAQRPSPQRAAFHPLGQTRFYGKSALYSSFAHKDSEIACV